MAESLKHHSHLTSACWENLQYLEPWPSHRELDTTAGYSLQGVCPSWDHYPNEPFHGPSPDGQHITASFKQKETHPWMALFSWRREATKRIQSPWGCPPAKKSPNAECDESRQSERFDIRLWWVSNKYMVLQSGTKSQLKCQIQTSYPDTNRGNGFSRLQTLYSNSEQWGRLNSEQTWMTITKYRQAQLPASARIYAAGLCWESRISLAGLVM